MTTISGLPLKILKQHNWSGAIYPVNPRYDEIAGTPCFPSIREVPGEVDVALVVIRADLVPQALRDCGEAGVRFAVVISSGFAEQVDAVERQRELEEVRDAYPAMRILGPNAQGLFNIVDDVPIGFNASTDYDRGLSRLQVGNVASVSQSGGLGFATFQHGMVRRLGFSHVVSTGNEVDLDLVDVAHHLLAEESTKVLLLFIEGLDDPSVMTSLLDSARERGKVVVVGKAGASPAGRRCALAHTAHQAGVEEEWAKVLTHPAAVRAEDLEDMVDLGGGFSRTVLPAGRRAAILTTSGGGATWAADALTQLAVELPVLSDATRALIDPLIPAYGSSANPVDATAQVLGQGGLAPLLGILADCGEVDIALVIVPAHVLALEREALREIIARFPVVVHSYTNLSDETHKLMEDLNVACMTNSRSAARVVAALVDVGVASTAQATMVDEPVSIALEAGRR